jgi:excisionase family DNA binding protein
MTDASAVNELLTGGSPDTVVTLPDIASAFGRSVRTVYRWTETGGLSYRQVGSTRFVTRRSLTEWLAERDGVIR